MYENVPPYCQHCWHVGHPENLCHVNHPELKSVGKRPVISGQVYVRKESDHAQQCPSLDPAVVLASDVPQSSQAPIGIDAHVTPNPGSSQHDDIVVPPAHQVGSGPKILEVHAPLEME